MGGGRGDALIYLSESLSKRVGVSFLQLVPGGGPSAFLPVKTIAERPLELAPKRLQVHRQWKTGKWDFDVVDWAEK
jgi:hypothetical protein